MRARTSSGAVLLFGVLALLPAAVAGCGSAANPPEAAATTEQATAPKGGQEVRYRAGS